MFVYNERNACPPTTRRPRAAGPCGALKFNRGRKTRMCDGTGHVWTAPDWQEVSSRVQQWSEQRCVRSVGAVHVTMISQTRTNSASGRLFALAIVTEITKAQHRGISVDDNPGRDIVFTLRFGQLMG
jgi:hypothetical protein